MKQIANGFTLLNLVFGCMAIYAAIAPGFITTMDSDGISTFVILPEKIYLASVFIGCAAIIDFLDGFIARLLNAASPMGKELDSLADVVSFGVAPSMIAIQFLKLSFAKDATGIDTNILWLLPAFWLSSFCLIVKPFTPTLQVAATTRLSQRILAPAGDFLWPRHFSSITY